MFNVPSLQHESGNDPVKRRATVAQRLSFRPYVAPFAKSHEIFNRLRVCIAEEPDLDPARPVLADLDIEIHLVGHFEVRREFKQPSDQRKFVWLLDQPGLDPEEDKDLFYIAKEGLKAPLPKDWKPCKETADSDESAFALRRARLPPRRSPPQYQRDAVSALNPSYSAWLGGHQPRPRNFSRPLGYSAYTP